MVKYKISISVMLFLSMSGINLLSAEANHKSPVLAWVGEDSITVEQFVGLFELNPRIKNSNSTGLTAARIDFLHTLIGNKLWCRFRERTGIDTTLAERTAKNELLMMFTLDYLYRKKILEEAEPSEVQIQSAYGKALKTLVVNSLFSQSGEEIGNLYGLLEQGFEFEEVADAINKTGKQQESILVKFGDYEQQIEDELFGLNAGDYSKPIPLEDGCYIFHISNIHTKSYLDSQSDKEELIKIKEVLRKRNENKIYNEYIKYALSDKEVVVNKHLKEGLMLAFDETIRNNLCRMNVDDSTYLLSPTDVIEIERSLGKNNLSMQLIKIDTLVITLGSYLRAMVFFHPKIDLVDYSCQKYIASNLSDYILKLILYEEAKKLRYNNVGEVLMDLEMWTEYFSFESVRASISDTVKITNEMIKEAGSKVYGYTSDSTFFNDVNKTELIRKQLVDMKVGKTLKYETAELARNVKIKINYGLLQSLETSHINSFAIRRLGFGSSFPAVPIYFPNSQWVNPENYRRFIVP